MTARLDLKWRRYAVSTLGLANGASVLDIACGTGDFLRMLRSQQYQAIGADFSFGMLQRSHEQNLIQCDANKLPFPSQTFQGATCGFALRNFVDLNTVFSEIARVLKPNGCLAMVEISRPKSPIIAKAHALYFDNIMPAMGSIIAHSNAYKYLSASTAYLPSEVDLRSMLANTGFKSIEIKYFMFGSAQVISATRELR